MDNNEHKKKLHIGALILLIIIVILLFKVNLEKSINSPQFQSNVSYIERQVSNMFNSVKGFFNIATPINIDQSVIESKVQPDKIYNYFGIPSNDTINKLASPNTK